MKYVQVTGGNNESLPQRTTFLSNLREYGKVLQQEGQETED
jgi:hypothetical protein